MHYRLGPERDGIRYPLQSGIGFLMSHLRIHFSIECRQFQPHPGTQSLRPQFPPTFLTVLLRLPFFQNRSVDGNDHCFYGW